MGTKTKKLDTVSKTKKAKSAAVVDKSKPLLSILEPTSAPSKETKKKIIKSHHKKIAASALVISAAAFFIISVAGAAYAHQSIYENRVYPGVTVWGEDVGGKTMTEVQELITSKIQNFKVNIKGPDQNYSADALALGLNFNSESMALSAYSKGRTSSFWSNYFTRARLLGTRINWEPSKRFFRTSELAILPSYYVNQTVLDNYVDKISTNINIAAKDSQVKVDKGTVTLIPAIFGREVETDDLKTRLIASIEKFSSVEISVTTREVAPKIIDNSVQEVMVQAENIMNRPVVLTYEGQTFSPNKQTIASWLTFVKPAGKNTYKLVVDTGRMSQYMNFLGTKLNIYPVNKKVQVKNGVRGEVIQEGKDGLLIDQVSLSRGIANALPVQTSVNLAIPMYVAKYKTEYKQILVANWDKYIDIDLSTQTMTAYLKGGVYVGSWKVTTGNSSHPTPVGTTLIYGKSYVTRMTGGIPGVDYYDLPNVHYVTWFKTPGYSIHEAYWRTVFGGADYVWNGSHGCVNAPYNVAKFIYNWAPIGTPVVVHY